MKFKRYRIVKRKNGLFYPQFRFLFFPFWSNFEKMTGYDYFEVVSFNSHKEALEHINWIASICDDKKISKSKYEIDEIFEI